MTNERKNEICDLLIEGIESGLSVFFICILLNRLEYNEIITVAEGFEFRTFMRKHKPENTGSFSWWDGSEIKKRINFLKLLKTKEWTQ